MAIFSYLIQEVVEEDRTLGSVIELVRLADIEEDVPNFVSPLDVLFQELEQKTHKILLLHNTRFSNYQPGKQQKYFSQLRCTSSAIRHSKCQTVGIKRYIGVRFNR